MRSCSQVDGVENVTVSLEGKCAFVMGTAPPDALIAAVCNLRAGISWDSPAGDQVDGAGGCSKFKAELFQEPEAEGAQLY